jgi:nucleotide-binding universal stress UspA family protein
MTLMYRNILVPVDMSHKGRGATMLEVAKRLADDGARITLLSIVEDVPSYVMVQLPEHVIDEAKAIAHEELEAIAAEAGVEADIEVGRGRAHSAILAHAERSGVDLIVIASHDPGLQDYLLGSTAARVVRHANCTVLVIR